MSAVAPAMVRFEAGTESNRFINAKTLPEIVRQEGLDTLMDSD